MDNENKDELKKDSDIKDSNTNDNDTNEDKKENKETKICPNCGAENPIDAGFCYKCGKNLNNMEDTDKKEKSPEEKLRELEQEILRERQNAIKKRLKEEEENPRMRRTPNGNSPTGGRLNFKTLAIIAIIAAIIASIFPMVKDNQKTPTQEISYTEFLEKIRDLKIDSVTEKDGYVVGTAKSDQNGFRTRLLTFRIGTDEKLMALIEQNNVKLNSLPPDEPSILLSILSSWAPFLLIIGLWIFMLNRMNKGNGGGPQIFNMGRSKAKEGENISKVTFADVAGITESKKELEEVVEFLREPEKFRKVGAKIPKGVLLLGAPGTGKTLLAKAVAGEAKVPFFSMSGSEFVEMFVGVGASRVRDLFSKARKNSPCIIFIDEIDAVGRKRGTGSGGGNDEREQTLNQLLVEMDGFGNEETIIVLAATNRPDVLDKALLRPGRFDRRVYIDMPDRNGREAILKVHAKGKILGKDVDLKDIARQTYGLAGADLANLLNEAAILAARSNRKEITMADIQEATEKAAMGPEKKSKVISENDRKITAYHEAGHAVVEYYLPGADPVYKITIVPRGWAGGYTMPLSDDEIEKTHEFKRDFLNAIKMAFGGRAAEEIVCDDISTGASQDIKMATGYASAMVTKYGMSDKFGPILLDGTQEGDMFQSRYYSDSTGKEVDEEIRKIITECYKAALDILTEHRDKLDSVTNALLEKDTINRQEFEAIMKDGPLPPADDTSNNGDSDKNLQNV